MKMAVDGRKAALMVLLPAACSLCKYRFVGFDSSGNGDKFSITRSLVANEVVRGPRGCLRRSG
jgi:hypothetical protein